MDAVRLQCQRVILMIYFHISAKRWTLLRRHTTATNGYWIFLHRVDCKTKCLQEFVSPPSENNICSRNVFGKNQIPNKKYLDGLLKDLIVLFWNPEESDSLQEEPRGKYKGTQIISEVRRLVAEEQRPTGLGLLLVSRCRRCSRFCTQISHNPGTLNAPSF